MKETLAIRAIQTRLEHIRGIRFLPQKEWIESWEMYAILVAHQDHLTTLRETVKSDYLVKNLAKGTGTYIVNNHMEIINSTIESTKHSVHWSHNDKLIRVPTINCPEVMAMDALHALILPAGIKVGIAYYLKPKSYRIHAIIHGKTPEWVESLARAIDPEVEVDLYKCTLSRPIADSIKSDFITERLMG